MSELSKKITEQIESKAIGQTPSWIFGVRNALFWSLYIISITIGGKALALTIYRLRNAEFLFALKAHGVDVSLLRLIPSFWFILFALFLLVAVLGYHQTRGGYKIEPWKLVAANLAFTLSLALLLSITTLPKQIENAYERFDSYESVDDRREAFWSDERHGRLAGIIVEVLNESFELEDARKREWLVEYDNNDVCAVRIEVGERVRVIGQYEDDVFEAVVVLPWDHIQAQQAGCDDRPRPIRMRLEELKK